MSRMKFMNTYIDNLTMHEALDRIEDLIRQDVNAYVITPNVDHIVRLEKDREFQQIYESANLVLVDGKPLLWIAKLYGTPIKEKISGSDLFPLLCKRAAEKGYGMFFLGAKEGVASKASDRLRLRYPKLNVVGTYSPPYGFENDEQELAIIEKLIKNSKPHILIVCFGAPKQEKFIMKYRSRLNVPISLGLGASLDFEAGNIKRAPKWMSRCGLEWLYRLLKEPKRLAKRYLRDAFEIIPIVLKYR